MQSWVEDPGVYRTDISRQRRIATAALWFLTVLSGTEIVAASDGLSWVLVVAALSAVFLYADPFHRIWPRRRVTLADLPVHRPDLRSELPDATPETVRVR